MIRVALWIAFALIVVAPTAPFGREVGEPFQAPSLEHWFGTDDLGRDVFHGVAAGARSSLWIGLGTATIALLLGAAIGVTAGFAGGLVDELLMRVTEAFQVVPRFFLALVVLTIWPYDWTHLVLVLGVTSWSGLARLARAETLTLREREFVTAARASGASPVRVLAVHVLPGAMRPLAAALPLIASGAMLTEAGLSFLGIGTLERVSWGYLLSNAQPFLREAWWMAVFPGVSITLAVLALALLSLPDLDDAAERLRVART